ncbi:hypothetical protein SAMN05421759_1206 [Roseivivax lentus]|uniref:O-Antigen ligase n=1 Tax=Roseivivax lentus TaxID=633194 RepID=A0A1N7PTX0_9RHOB|nr:hypothetical protein [Roseivivax lentus]SIT13889.1 hypothetical protein SAMN05421759_1206 [Roseivivax lentus]
MLSLWGAFLSPFIAYYTLKIKITKQFSHLLTLCVAYTASGLILGLAYGNNLSDLAGDFLKSLFIPAGIGLYCIFRDEGDYVERKLFLFGSMFILARTALFISMLGSITRLYYGTSLDALLVCVAMKRNAIRKDVGLKSRLWPKFHYVVILASLIGQKRTVLIAFLVYLTHNRVKTLILVMVIGIAALTLIDFADWRSVPFIGRLLSIGDIDFILENQSMRIAEVATSFRAWTSGVSVFLFGHGFGAEILVFTGREDYAESLHSLHNTLMAVAYRSGLVGLFLMLYLLKISFLDILFGSRSDGAIIVALFAASFFFFSFVDEVFIGYYAARSLETLSKRRRRHAI